MDYRYLGGCKPKPAKDRFYEKIHYEPMSGCHIYAGTERGSNSYGVIKVDKKPIPAHRYSWIINYGEIPEGMYVLHKCDTPSCVNPSHLFLGTHQDNVNDKVSKNRQAKGESLSIDQGERKKGELNKFSKLKDFEREEIKISNNTQRKLASKYGVSQTLIWRIKHG